MKIHLSNVDLESRSGPNSFAGRLSAQLKIRGHEFVSYKDEYECMLAFIEPQTEPRSNSLFVQRIDGIWFKPEEFIAKNRSIKSGYERSDHVIFQSNFDKQMIEHLWGRSNQSSVIHNGIKLEKIETKNPQILQIRKRFGKIFVSSASWHRQKRLKENVELFLSAAGSDDDSCMLILGKNPDFLVSHPRIFYTGEIDHRSCLEIYGISDWMIHLAWLDHCPNVVVEALSQGCPIICSSSGGTKEIVRENGIIVEEKFSYNFELTDYDNPPEIFPESKIPEKIAVNSEYLDIERVAHQYESVISG